MKYLQCDARILRADPEFAPDRGVAVSCSDPGAPSARGELR
jgi:hypothetical protein